MVENRVTGSLMSTETGLRPAATIDAKKNIQNPRLGQAMSGNTAILRAIVTKHRGVESGAYAMNANEIVI